PEVVRHTAPLGRPVPESRDPEQNIAAVPGADALVSLLVVGRAEVARAMKLSLAGIAHRLGLGPVKQIGGAEHLDMALVRGRGCTRPALAGEVVHAFPLVKPGAFD